MSGIVRLTGPVRSTKPLFKRADGVQFGTEYGVLSECGGVLGETIKVVVFDARPGETPTPTAQLAEPIDWIVEVDAGQYGLSATFKADVKTFTAASAKSESRQS